LIVEIIKYSVRGRGLAQRCILTIFMTDDERKNNIWTSVTIFFQGYVLSWN